MSSSHRDFVLRPDNDFREGWLACFCGEDKDDRRTEAWRAGFDTCKETDSLEHRAIALAMMFEKGKVIATSARHFYEDDE